MFSCLHGGSVVKPIPSQQPYSAVGMREPQTYWDTTRTLDRSTSPFTCGAIVRPSDKSEFASKGLATYFENNTYVAQELASDAEGKRTLAIAIKMLLDRGISHVGYLKINVEHGAREIWVD